MLTLCLRSPPTVHRGWLCFSKQNSITAIPTSVLNALKSCRLAIHIGVSLLFLNTDAWANKPVCTEPSFPSNLDGWHEKAQYAWKHFGELLQYKYNHRNVSIVLNFYRYECNSLLRLKSDIEASLNRLLKSQKIRQFVSSQDVSLVVTDSPDWHHTTANSDTGVVEVSQGLVQSLGYLKDFDLDAFAELRVRVSGDRESEELVNLLDKGGKYFAEDVILFVIAHELGHLAFSHHRIPRVLDRHHQLVEMERQADAFAFETIDEIGLENDSDALTFLSVMRHLLLRSHLVGGGSWSIDEWDRISAFPILCDSVISLSYRYESKFPSNLNARNDVGLCTDIYRYYNSVYPIDPEDFPLRSSDEIVRWKKFFSFLVDDWQNLVSR